MRRTGADACCRGSARRVTAAAVAEDVRHEIQLQAGDLLVIDNRRCLHGRNSFVPRHDGTDRWLERVYVRAEVASAGRIL